MDPKTGQDPNEANPDAAAGSAGDEPKSFDADYVKKLRAEAAEQRTALKQLKAQLAALEGANNERETAALAEQGKFKDLFEKEKAEREKLAAALEATQAQALRTKVGLAAGLPAALIERLQGNTEEELNADAEALKAILPPPSPPAPGGRQTTTTAVPGGNPGAPTDAELRRELFGGVDVPVFGDG